MPGTFKNYIKSRWEQFKSAVPNKPKKSGQRDERRHPRPDGGNQAP